MATITQGTRFLDANTGKYLATAAIDIDGRERFSAEMFSDVEIDISDFNQRLPLTSALLRALADD